MEHWRGIAAFVAAAILVDAGLSGMHARGWIYYEGLTLFVLRLLRGTPGDRR